MNPSERINEPIAGLTDWRGKMFASIRKSILEADREIIASEDLPAGSKSVFPIPRPQKWRRAEPRSARVHPPITRSF
jgi:hypothetical protein